MRYKSLNIFILLLLGLALVASCCSDDDAQGDSVVLNTVTASNELMTFTLNEESIAASRFTRAVTDGTEAGANALLKTAFAVGDEIGVFVIDEYAWANDMELLTSSWTYGYENVKLTVTDVDEAGNVMLSPSEPIYYPYGKDTLTLQPLRVAVLAYYPYDSSKTWSDIKNGYSVTMPTDQTDESSITNNDHIFGFPENLDSDGLLQNRYINANGVTVEKGSVNLSMLHLCTNVRFNDITVTMSSDEIEQYGTDFDKVDVYFNSKNSATFDIRALLNDPDCISTPEDYLDYSDSSSVLVASYSDVTSYNKFSFTCMTLPQTITKSSSVSLSFIFYKDGQALFTKSYRPQFGDDDTATSVVYEPGSIVSYGY